jgi:hypothetical protein
VAAPSPIRSALNKRLGVQDPDDPTALDATPAAPAPPAPGAPQNVTTGPVTTQPVARLSAASAAPHSAVG